MESDLLNGASSAASFLGLSRRQVYRMAELGLVPCVRKGRRIYFRKSELERAFSAECGVALLAQLDLGELDWSVV